jgi:hypothetical protein
MQFVALTPPRGSVRYLGGLKLQRDPKTQLGATNLQALPLILMINNTQALYGALGFALLFSRQHSPVVQAAHTVLPPAIVRWDL